MVLSKAEESRGRELGEWRARAGTLADTRGSPRFLEHGGLDLTASGGWQNSLEIISRELLSQHQRDANISITWMQNP